MLADRAGEADCIGYAILGGGPAGLTAAYTLGLRGQEGRVFEADGSVGGIAKTVEFKGYRFDLGGHRFFTKLAQVERIWDGIMGDEFLTRPRLSRIYYKNRFFDYPLRGRDVVQRLGLVESALCVLSYFWALRHRGKQQETFEEWVVARFGRRLYNTFFKSYTEKVWGMPGSEIRAKWAAQRIKNFSLWQAAMTILGIRRQHVTTLIEEFKYPRLGPGQMWERLADRLASDFDIPVGLNERVVSVNHRDGEVTSVSVEGGDGLVEHSVDGVISSIPLSQLVFSLQPAAPQHVLEAARGLRYRDFCLVALMTTQDEPFPDNWIYIHDPGLRAGRVQNFGAWSPDMVVHGHTCLGVEYFCWEGDEMWEMPSDDAVRFATEEMARIGLVDPSKVVDGVKVRVPKAYPVYDAEYQGHVDTIRAYLEGFPNLQTCGRNGLHRYNNQDHSMWTAILATLNLVEGASHDVWSVNVEEVYHEEGEAVDGLLDVDLVG